MKIVPISEANGKLQDFDLFWDCYPRKKAKLDAMKAWEQTKRTRPPIEQIIAAVRNQSQTWTEKCWIPYPASWLRAGQFLDED